MFKWLFKNQTIEPIQPPEPECEHDWGEWSDLEYVGAEYKYTSGNLYYAQRKTCRKCNRTVIQNQTIKGNHFDARIAEMRKNGESIKTEADLAIFLLA